MGEEPCALPFLLGNLLASEPLFLACPSLPLAKPTPLTAPHTSSSPVEREVGAVYILQSEGLLESVPVNSFKMLFTSLMWAR